jgi:sensor histidine kinase YesM
MSSASPVNDITIRIVMIPFFGIFIPNLTGLFGPIGPSSFLYWAGYGYFILLSFLLWQGNRFFLLQQRKHLDWFRHPVRKILVLVFANVFYTAPVTVLMLMGWYAGAGFDGPDWNTIELVTLLNVIAVLFITHMYETVFLIREREHDIVEVERLERAKAQSELEALRNQIDPHFMFNSLNTLSSLIEDDSGKALAFTESLSDVYRYILMNKGTELVQLADEIAFLNNYYALLRLRFGEAIMLTVHDDRQVDAYLIPPISLQLLMENAVKHNEFDETDRLRIDLQIRNAEAILANSVKPRRILNGSSRIGLKNLNERYRMVTGKEIDVFADENVFRVTLPLLRIA